MISIAGVASKARSGSDFERTVASKPCRSGIYRAGVPSKARSSRDFARPEASQPRASRDCERTVFSKHARALFRAPSCYDAKGACAMCSSAVELSRFPAVSAHTGDSNFKHISLICRIPHKGKSVQCRAGVLVHPGTGFLTPMFLRAAARTLGCLTAVCTSFIDEKSSGGTIH